MWWQCYLVKAAADKAALTVSQLGTVPKWLHGIEKACRFYLPKETIKKPTGVTVSEAIKLQAIFVWDSGRVPVSHFLVYIFII